MRTWRSASTRGAYSAQLQPSDTRSSTATGNRLREPIIEGAAADIDMETANGAATEATDGNANSNAGGNNQSRVDRNTSVRSVMTLPAYSATANPNEQVLGKEGERAGIDVVLEHPETVDEEEERRDEEMEALYQIRRARRQEAAEREERRRQRREARDRGDLATLARLETESRRRAAEAADGLLLSAQLIAEHQARSGSRDHRVSSVQYADVGVARHDGSRVRAASFESDQRPLLDSAASFGAAGAAGRPGSETPSGAGYHRRSDVSMASSLASDEARGSSEFTVVALDARSSRSPSLAPSTSYGSAPAAETDANGNILSPPPDYDAHLGWGAAPPYEGPVATAAPRLSAMPPVLPAIQITEHPLVVPLPSHARQ